MKKSRENTLTEPNPAGKKKIFIILAVIFAVVIVAGVFVGIWLNREYNKKVDAALNRDTFYQGIILEGIELGGKTKEEAKALLSEVEPDLRETIDLTLVYGEQSFHYTQDQFDFTYNTDEMIEQAYEIGRKGSRKERYQTVMQLQEEPIHLEIVCQMDDSKIEQIVAEVAAQLDTPPVDPTTTFNPNSDPMFVSVEGKNGFSINQEQACTDIRNILNTTKQGTVTLQATEIPFTGPADPLAERTKLISTFSTVSTNDSNGNHNMALALSKINGTVLNPGETFSYNGTIGNSTTAAGGWRKAGALVNGKTVQEYGGGICQVSTTLYGAVLRADLEIVERHNHRWPSTYVKIGQDATVDYPGLDFKFKNNTDNPIYIQGYMSGTKVIIKLYGKPSSEWDTIEVVSQTTETIPAPETIRQDDPELPVGTEEVDIKSRAGYRAAGSKIYYKDGKEVKREAIPSSYYRPVQGVIKVGTKPAEGSEQAAPPTDQTAPPTDQTAPPTDQTVPPTDQTAPPADPNAPIQEQTPGGTIPTA